MIPRLRPPFSLPELLQAFARPQKQPRERFERKFADHFGFPHALTFAYGRAGMYALLQTLGWEDREIVLPAYTCVVMAHAITVSGNRPRFVDCRPKHFNVAPEALAAACKRDTAMAVPTPIFGYPLDLARTLSEVRRVAPDAFVLLDAAQGFNVTDEPAASCRHADAMLVGLGIGKMISTLNGGVLLLRDDDLYNRLRGFRDRQEQAASHDSSLRQLIYGFATWAAFREPLIGLCDTLEHDTSLLWRFTDKFYGKEGIHLPEDIHIRRPEACWKLGEYQLSRLSEITAQRRRLSERYTQRLREAGFALFDTWTPPSYSCFPLLVNNRRAVVEAMRRRGVQLGILIDYACNDLPGYDADATSCPNAACYGQRMVNLPNFPDLKPRHIDCIVEHLIALRRRHPQWFPSSVDARPDKPHTKPPEVS
jgi:dTDP-4-amino-4,6-dideoxygalactose transaminase